MTDSEVRQFMGRLVAVELADGGAAVGKLVSGEFLGVTYALERLGNSWSGLPDAEQIVAIHPFGDA